MYLFDFDYSGSMISSLKRFFCPRSGTGPCEANSFFLVTDSIIYIVLTWTYWLLSLHTNLVTLKPGS